LELVDSKQYNRRYRICPDHFSALGVAIEGETQRFCQQCAKFHPIGEFSGTRKSCQSKLNQHNQRRRRAELVKGGPGKKTTNQAAAAAAAQTYNSNSPNILSSQSASLATSSKGCMVPISATGDDPHSSATNSEIDLNNSQSNLLLPTGGVATINDSSLFTFKVEGLGGTAAPEIDMTTNANVMMNNNNRHGNCVEDIDFYNADPPGSPLFIPITEEINWDMPLFHELLVANELPLLGSGGGGEKQNGNITIMNGMHGNLFDQEQQNPSTAADNIAGMGVDAIHKKHDSGSSIAEIQNVGEGSSRGGHYSHQNQHEQEQPSSTFMDPLLPYHLVPIAMATAAANGNGDESVFNVNSTVAEIRGLIQTVPGYNESTNMMGTAAPALINGSTTNNTHNNDGDVFLTAGSGILSNAVAAAATAANTTNPNNDITPLIGYSSPDTMVRLSFKVFDCDPSNLHPSLRTELEHMMHLKNTDSLEGYLRPGCTVVSASAMVSKKEEGGRGGKGKQHGELEGMVATMLAKGGLTSDCHSGRHMLVQLGNQVVVVRNSQVQSCITVAKDALPQITSMNPVVVCIDDCSSANNNNYYNKNYYNNGSSLSLLQRLAPSTPTCRIEAVPSSFASFVVSSLSAVVASNNNTNNKRPWSMKIKGTGITGNSISSAKLSVICRQYGTHLTVELPTYGVTSNNKKRNNEKKSSSKENMAAVEEMEIRPLNLAVGCAEIEVQQGNLLSATSLPLLVLPDRHMTAEVGQLAVNSSGINNVSEFLRDLGQVVTFLYRNELKNQGRKVDGVLTATSAADNNDGKLNGNLIAAKARRLAAAAAARGWSATFRMLLGAVNADSTSHADADEAMAVMNSLAPSGLSLLHVVCASGKAASLEALIDWADRAKHTTTTATNLLQFGGVSKCLTSSGITPLHIIAMSPNRDAMLAILTHKVCTTITMELWNTAKTTDGATPEFLYALAEAADGKSLGGLFSHEEMHDMDRLLEAWDARKYTPYNVARVARRLERSARESIRCRLDKRTSGGGIGVKKGESSDDDGKIAAAYEDDAATTSFATNDVAARRAGSVVLLGNNRALFGGAVPATTILGILILLLAAML